MTDMDHWLLFLGRIICFTCCGSENDTTAIPLIVSAMKPIGEQSVGARSDFTDTECIQSKDNTVIFYTFT